MDSATILEKAIALAVEAHAGQLDKAGNPYILHPLHLMAQMDTLEERLTAVLHDVVEDSAVTLADLAALGVPDSVLEAVRLLTHETAVSYDDYIAALKQNPLARRIKLADLAHNMDVRRLQSVTPKDWERFAKYRRAWETLIHDEKTV